MEVNVEFPGINMVKTQNGFKTNPVVRNLARKLKQQCLKLIMAATTITVMILTIFNELMLCR